LRAHGVMTNLLVQESGKYRGGDEGVFDKDKCIFMAPPAERVPFLVQDLLDWVKREGKNVHPLIMSCVVHYELVFIHPFSDGNGRMARLWQTLILSRWQEMFAYLPVESQIEKFQSAYYKTIDKCNRNGNSSLFIEFMLERIKSVLEEVLQLGEKDEFDNVAVQKLLSVMDNHKNYSALELMELLKIQTRVTLQKTYLKPAIEIGVVEMTMPDKPTSKNQKYRRI
ncbi:MAG: Fic family protein, partial [Phascolarctobacterium sp.]|nr:Fic family protein [Candidatus Phascolarctobacterium equi]